MTTTNKIIFLDFDGVIRIEPYGFCDGRMRSLYDICRTAGAKIVISSNWKDFGLREVKKHLSPWLSECLHRDWKTPSGESRWQEIAEWLDHHKVGSYVILDDLQSLYKGSPPDMRKRLLICTKGLGLQTGHVTTILNHLTH